MTETRLEGLEVEWVPIGDVFPNPANPRRNEAAVGPVADSLRRFGWQQPIVAKPSGEVIAGNTRLLAARQLGMDRVPVVRFAGSEIDALAFSIADNRTGEIATWDEEALREVLTHLQAEDALDGVGYTAEELEVLLASLDPEGGEVVEDQAPELLDDAVSRAGDVWVLGGHRLLCGDSARWEDVERLTQGEPVQLLNTDPPYNVKVEPRSNNAIAAGLSSFAPTKQTHHQKLDLARHPEKAKPTGKMRAKDRPLTNDFVSDEEFARLLGAWFGNAAHALAPGRSFYVWGGYANLGNYPHALKAAGLYFSQGIVWDKQHPVLTRKDFMGAFELCFYGWKEGAAHQWFGPSNATDLWQVKKLNHTTMVHLTEKPVELAARAMGCSSKKGERILDLFGGSGSTLMAAEQLERRALLMEIDALYCDVIVRRWEAFTKREAVLEATGETFAAVAKARLGAVPEEAEASDEVADK